MSKNKIKTTMPSGVSGQNVSITFFPLIIVLAADASFTFTFALLSLDKRSPLAFFFPFFLDAAPSLSDGVVDSSPFPLGASDFVSVSPIPPNNDSFESSSPPPSAGSVKPPPPAPNIPSPSLGASNVPSHASRESG